MPFRWIGNFNASGSQSASYNPPAPPRRHGRIEVDKTKLTFNNGAQEISGTLYLFYRESYSRRLENPRRILICLAADVIVQFDTKIDTRIVTTSGTKNVLNGVGWAEICVYGTTDPFGTTTELPKEDLVFPFTFKIGDRMPASISWTGNYSVTCCVKAYADDAEICSSPSIWCYGNYDLSLDPNSIRPIICDKSLYKGMFSTKCLVKMTLRALRMGYLPGACLPINVSINNISGIPMTKLCTSLIRRSVAKEGGKSRRYLTKLSEKYKDLGDTTKDYTWECTFIIPTEIPPTFTSTQIDIQYFLKMELLCKGPEVVKAETEVLIGTKFGEKGIIMLDASSSVVCGNGLMRRASAVSSTSTQPPSYSTLSSRRQSVETLPPTYDDLARGGIAKLNLRDDAESNCSKSSTK